MEAEKKVSENSKLQTNHPVKSFSISQGELFVA